MPNDKKFSVLMSVYKNDSPLFVKQAVSSIVNQTLKPSEVVIVIDGPIGEQLDQLIKTYESNPLFNVIRLKENAGLGLALKEGLAKCSYEIVARMDSDDLSIPHRFEVQYQYLMAHPKVDVVGSDISEFIGNEENVVSYRRVPESNQEIYKEMQTRCALNHVSVMFKKQAVEQSGGYQELHFNEDYYLWIRMMLNKCVFADIPETLVNVRIGQEMYARRGGYQYFKSEHFLQKFMLSHQIIGIRKYIINTLKRLIVQVMLPGSVRAYVFKAFAREKS